MRPSPRFLPILLRSCAPIAPPHFLPPRSHPPRAVALSLLDASLSPIPLHGAPAALSSRAVPSPAMVVHHNRYMVLEMVASHGLRLADVRIAHNDVVSAIHDSLLANFGEFGLAASLPSLQVKYVNGGTGVCVVRSSRKQYRMVWAAITFITEIRKLPLFFNLLDLSGSTSACRRAAQQCDSEKLRLLKLDKHTLSTEQLEYAESMQSRIASLD